MKTKKINLNEIGFEEFIEQELITLHKFRSRPNSKYNKEFCIDTELLFEFIKNTQGNTWNKLSEQYEHAAEEKFLQRLDSEIENQGLLFVLKEGIKDRGCKFDFAYSQPVSNDNPESIAHYKANIFSITRQVKYAEDSNLSIDFVIFLNGLPLFTCELKNQFTGQNVLDAIKQYQTDRDKKEKLLSFKRCLCHFAIDNEQVFMTTKLNGLATKFLPFNMGNNGGAGNPTTKDKYKTYYLWEDVFSSDSILELIFSFIQEITENIEINGKKIKDSKLIFPRYHQRDAVKKIIAHSKNNKIGNNYLIQHSAGSGKSNTIAWCAYRLVELKDDKNNLIFNSVIVITDRRNLDKALSDTIKNFSKIHGFHKHVESAKELKEALEAGVKIISSTIQKFPIITETIDKISGTNFAVIIDEAHSSQSGESAADLRYVLGDLDDAEKKEISAFKTVEDYLIDRIKARKVKSKNINVYAFTATPKQKTLELFGHKDLEGRFAPFSLYSMKQAIEERFILDVLKNYTTYETYFGLLKKVSADPSFDKKKTQRLLLGYVSRNEHVINEKIEIMLEHFKDQIHDLINGQAKAMIVTKSRLHAVRYKLAFDAYTKKKGYNFKSLVAFSGKVKDKDTDKEFTESKMNGGISDKLTVETFKKNEYKFMIVADKFQTGFDQPLLAVMYVDKKLNGINAVQTLSRLNRAHTGKEEVFILDFVNDVQDIKNSFQPYYISTILSESTDPNILYNLERDIQQFRLFNEFEVSEFVKLCYSDTKPDKLNSFIDKIIERIKTDNRTEQEVIDFKLLISDFIKKYGFISQIISFSDSSLEKLYIFLKYLLRRLPKRNDKLPLEVLDAVNIDSYKVQRGTTYKIELDNVEGVFEPISTYTTGPGGTIEEPEQLSVIIKEINERFGTDFTEVDKVILNSISNKLLSSEILSLAFKNNQGTDSVKIKFDELFQSELIGMLNNHFDLYKKLDESPELKKFVCERIFNFVVGKLD